jgi:hypothetical protein
MKPFTVLTVLVLLAVAVIHLLRAVLGWEVTVDGGSLPMWVSWAAVVVAAVLAIGLWRERA